MLQQREPARSGTRAPRSATYDAAHRNVRHLDDGGNWDAAVKLATGTTANGTGVTFAAFDKASASDLDSQAGRVGSRSQLGARCRSPCWRS